MKKCEICGTAMSDDVADCPTCGASMGGIKTVEQPAEERMTETAAKSDDKVCSVCGATVAAKKKFCPQCGNKMEQPPDEVHKEEPAAETAAIKDDKVCSVCGATVAASKKFCPQCGNKMEQPPVESKERVCPTCGAIVAAGKKFCSDCGTRMSEDKPPVNFCPQCGAKVEAGKKFCSDCGTALGAFAAPRPATTSAAKASVGGVINAAKVKQLLPTIGIMLTLLFTVIFMFVPFLSVKMSVGMLGLSGKSTQHGVVGLGVLFTGESELISGGVDEIVLRLAGAGYVLLLLAVIWYILFAISTVYKYDKDSLNHQIIFSAILTSISLFLMILSAITKSQIEEEMKKSLNASTGGMGAIAAGLVDTKWVMGAVGLFVPNVILFVYAIAMRAIYKPALDRPALTPYLLSKPTRRVLAAISTSVIMACIVIPIVMGCSGSKGGAATKPNKATEISSSGTFTVKCTDVISEDFMTMYYGVVFYTYTPATDGTISVEVTSPNAQNSMTSLAAVGIAEYDEVYSTYKQYGNETVADEYVDDTYTSCRVEAGTKYAIVFCAASITKDDKVVVSYEFDDGGTRGSGSGGGQGSGSTRGNAVPLVLNSGVSTGSISSGSGMWYKFTPDESTTYRIYSANVVGDPDLKVYEGNSSDVKRGDESAGGFDIEIAMTANTTFYIEIFSFSSTASCTLYVEKKIATAGDSRESAIALTLGTSVSTNSINGGDSKWYKFTPSTSGDYVIRSSAHTGDPDVNVYSSLTSNSKYKNDDDIGGFELGVYLSSYNTYYIEIHASGSTSSCTFSVTKASSDNPYVSDGSSRSTAIQMSLGSYQSTGPISGSESKWYKYTPTKNGYYRIRSTNFSGDPDLSVYDSATSITKYKEDNEVDGFDLTLYMAVNVTYYIEIESYSSSVYSSCTFSITFLY